MPTWNELFTKEENRWVIPHERVVELADRIQGTKRRSNFRFGVWNRTSFDLSRTAGVFTFWNGYFRKRPALFPEMAFSGKPSGSPGAS